jgi:hypothetical protein
MRSTYLLAFCIFAITITISVCDVAVSGDSVTIALQINKTGSGSGHVTSSEFGIDCGEQCSGSIDFDGTPISVNVYPDTGSMFDGWECHAMTSTYGWECTVTFSAACDTKVVSGVCLDCSMSCNGAFPGNISAIVECNAWQAENC